MYERKRELSSETVRRLARSIQNNGLLSPIVVMSDRGAYSLVSGMHRLEAFKLLELVDRASH